MKKLSIAFIGLMSLVLAVFSSCSMSQQKSSISFCLPSDTSDHLSLFRDVEETDTTDETPFFVKFTSTGDWENTETKNFAAVDELNDCQFAFDELTSGSNIDISIELGYNQNVYYKGEKEVQLVTGENQVAITLKSSAEIPDFNITAYYSKNSDTVYENGAASIIKTDDYFIFKNDCSYSENATVEWKINDQTFDGTINPTTSTLIKIGTNKVECTITDKNFAKITKTAAFEFSFLELPSALTLSLEEGVDAAALIYGQSYKLILSELTSLPEGTTYTWKLNNRYTNAVKDFTFDSLVCDVQDKTASYTLEVTASYESWSATGSISFKIAFGDSNVKVSAAVPDFTVKYSVTEGTDGGSIVVFEVEESLNINTDFIWKLNDTNLSVNSYTCSVNTLTNDAIRIGSNTISVTASYNGVYKSRTLDFTVSEDLTVENPGD